MRVAAALIVLLTSQANALEFTIQREEDRSAPFHVVRCAPVANAAPVPSAPEFNAFEAAKKPAQTDRANLRDAEANDHRATKINGLNPVRFGNPWVERGTGTTSDWHLIHVHGYTADQIRGLSQSQKNRLHGYAHEHGAARLSPPSKPSLGMPTMRKAFSGGCPGGVCPRR